MGKKQATIPGATATRRVLLVLFVPSADRAGKPLPNQEEWKQKALHLLGELYGGATAMPKAEGVWRDDDNGGKLIVDFPILLHCYLTEEQAYDRKLLARLGEFCLRMGKDLRQGEVALILDSEYHAFKGF